MPRLVLLLASAPLLAVASSMVALAPLGASAPVAGSAADARAALEAARLQQRNAAARGALLERQASAARAGADAALVRLAALAARVQQTEAGLAEAEARFTLARQGRAAIESKLARQREPLARLVGAVETLSRRPALLALFQRGSLADLVHTRAVLDSAAPLVERRTRALRGELVRLRMSEREAERALADRQAAQTALDTQRRDLVALAESQRLTASRAAGDAGREAARAMILGEEARDLDSLVGELESAGTLRARLAALPGPLLRPANPAADKPSAPAAAPRAAQVPLGAAPAPYQLPVDGRIAAGFGTSTASAGERRPGIALVPRPGAQVVAPAAGRIAFAGTYRGYGRIVIIEHGNGWTSLITGLGELGIAVGQRVTAGSPLGRAPARDPSLTLELRREGVAVNPLDQLR